MELDMPWDKVFNIDLKFDLIIEFLYTLVRYI